MRPGGYRIYSEVLLYFHQLPIFLYKHYHPDKILFLIYFFTLKTTILGREIIQDTLQIKMDVLQGFFSYYLMYFYHKIKCSFRVCYLRSFFNKKPLFKGILEILL